MEGSWIIKYICPQNTLTEIIFKDTTNEIGTFIQTAGNYHGTWTKNGNVLTMTYIDDIASHKLTPGPLVSKINGSKFEGELKHPDYHNGYLSWKAYNVRHIYQPEGVSQTTLQLEPKQTRSGKKY